MSVFALALALVIPTAAHAAAWLPPQDVSVPQSTSSCGFFCGNPGAAGVDVAVNSRGDTLVSWARRDDADTIRVQAALRPAGGTFGAPQNLGIAGGYFFGVLGDLIDAGIDDSGRAIVVWVDPSAPNATAKAATRAPGGTFGPAFNLSADTSPVTGSPRVAVSPSGHVAATWVQTIATKDLVHATSHGPGGAFPAASAVSAAGQSASNAVVAVDDAGAIALAWVRSDGSNYIAQGRVRPAGAAGFQPARDLSLAGNSAGSPDVTMDPTGRTTVLWQRPDGTRTRIQSRALNADGSIGGGIDDVSGDGINGASGRVAVDANNNAVAVWNGCPTGGGACAVEAASRTSGGSFGTPAAISGPTDNTSFALPNVIIDVNGTAVAAWPDLGSASPRIQSAARPRGGSFGDVVNISRDGGTSVQPNLATDGEGNTVGAWTFINATSNLHSAQIATFDAVAPVFTAVNVPAVAAPGQAVDMSVSATDRWSGASINWAFGDGAAANGASVSHAYGSEGVKTVTVTATDGAGNATTTTRTVQVTKSGGGAGGLDNDKDGFFAGQDCNDNNAKINPAAKEIRGNNIDEDCNGVASELPDLRSSALPTWSVIGSRTSMVAFALKGLRRGWTVTVSCKGKGCPFKSKKVKNKKVKTGDFNALKKLGKKRTFKAGQTLTVRFTARGYNTKFSIFKFKAGKLPSGTARCQTKGTTRLRACR